VGLFSEDGKENGGADTQFVLLPDTLIDEDGVMLAEEKEPVLFSRYETVKELFPLKAEDFLAWKKTPKDV